jgi:hypothetical protein
MKALVGQLSGGVCELAFGISIIEDVIKSTKKTEITKAIILFFSVFIFFLSYNCVWQNKLLIGCFANRTGIFASCILD